MLGLLMLVREFDPTRGGPRWSSGTTPASPGWPTGLASPDDGPPQAFPTAAVAVLGLTGPWAEAAPGEARLLAFTVPAELRG